MNYEFDRKGAHNQIIILEWAKPENVEERIWNFLIKNTLIVYAYLLHTKYELPIEVIQEEFELFSLNSQRNLYLQWIELRKRQSCVAEIFEYLAFVDKKDPTWYNQFTRTIRSFEKYCSTHVATAMIKDNPESILSNFVDYAQTKKKQLFKFVAANYELLFPYILRFYFKYGKHSIKRSLDNAMEIDEIEANIEMAKNRIEYNSVFSKNYAAVIRELGLFCETIPEYQSHAPYFKVIEK